MDDYLRRGFRLGDSRVSPLEGRISGPTGSSHVAPKSMDVLLCLARAAGEVVEHDVIRQVVWGEAEAGADAVSRCVSELRRHFRDIGSGAEYIRTIPKRGYQLVVPVAHGDTEDPGSEPAQSDERYASALVQLLENLRKRRVFRAVGVYAIFAWLTLQVGDVVLKHLGFPPGTMTILVLIVITGFPVTVIASWTLQVTRQGIVVDASGSASGGRDIRLRPVDYVIAFALLSILAYLAYQTTARVSPVVIRTAEGTYELPVIAAGPIAPNSVAVLPFRNLGTSRETENLGTGLAEDVLRLLTGINELYVPSRQQSFRYQDAETDLKTIADELRVRNILGGSVFGNDNELRVTAQLTEAESGDRRWWQTYRRSNRSLLSIRDEIAQAVVDSLRLTLSPESRTVLLDSPTQNAAAYDYYLQALTYLRRPKTAQTLTNAEGLFQRAIDLDPDYAEAYAGLCEVHLGKYRQFSQTEQVQPAERACRRALEHDPNLPEVHGALGALYRLTGRIDEAEIAFLRAIVLDPRLEPAFYGLGRVYMTQNRLEEAETIFQYAVQLEPGYWGTHLALGNFYLEFGSPDKAIAPFRRVTELNPNYAMGYNNLGAALYNTGNDAEGEQAFLKAIELAPTELAYSNLGMMYYNNARFGDAAAMFRRAIELSPRNYTLWGRLAAANRFIAGQEQEARQNFQSAIELAEDDLDVNPNDSRTLAYIAYYYANVDMAIEARGAMDRALQFGADDPHVHYFRAHVALRSGERGEALTALERAAELGYATTAIQSDPDFAPLYAEPRFQAIVN